MTLHFSRIPRTAVRRGHRGWWGSRGEEVALETVHPLDRLEIPPVTRAGPDGASWKCLLRLSWVTFWEMSTAGRL